MTNFRQNIFWVIIITIGWPYLVGCSDPYAQPKLTRQAPAYSDLAAARQQSIDALQKLALSDNAQLRANAIEAMSLTLGAGKCDYYIRGLRDEAPSVQFTAAMAIAQCKCSSARDYVLAMLADQQTNSSVRSALVLAMYKIADDPQYLSLLGPLLASDSAEVRANAAMVIGMTGLPDAAKPLKGQLRNETNDGVKTQIAESLAMIGDKTGFDMLRNYSRIGEPYQQVQAVSALGRAGNLDEAEAILRWAMSNNFAPPQRLAAAGALGNFGIQDGYPLAAYALADPQEYCEKACDQLAKLKPAEAVQLRCGAAIALGDIGDPYAVKMLSDMLGESNTLLRLSAARAILQLTDNIASDSASGAAEKTSRRQRQKTQAFSAPMK